MFRLRLGTKTTVGKTLAPDAARRWLDRTACVFGPRHVCLKMDFAPFPESGWSVNQNQNQIYSLEQYT
jgi:hypothetical protein